MDKQIIKMYAMLLHRRFYDPILVAGFWMLDKRFKFLLALCVKQPESSIEHLHPVESCLRQGHQRWHSTGQGIQHRCICGTN
jgi:hypothetical protein